MIYKDKILTPIVSQEPEPETVPGETPAKETPEEGEEKKEEEA